eukprot:m.182287 g.182287  ORF g.182287 m.182287 type:complete len:987 (+) comp16883_c0_seq1:64-3024(+)
MRPFISWLATALAVTAVFATRLEQLQQLQFGNEGVVYANDTFEYRDIDVYYLEPEKVTTTRYSWADRTTHPYLFRSQPNPPSDCKAATVKPGYDMSGNDLETIPLPTANLSMLPELCMQECCKNAHCSGVVSAVAPKAYRNCHAHEPCCYLKSHNAPFTPSSAPNITATVRSGSPSPPSPDVDSPPSGIRSAVPQGGLAAGSIELRGDGRLHEWTILNQSPAGAAKFFTFDNAFFGAQLTVDGRGASAALRTNPPAGVPGVNALKYAGAYPVGRLSVADDTFPGRVDLYAYSSYHINDLNRSLKPAAHYTLLASNPGASPMKARFMFNLPLRVEENTARPAKNSVTIPAADAVACLHACDGSPTCQSWTFSSKKECTLATEVPLNAYVEGSTSGLRGVWRVEERSDVLCLVLDNQVPEGPTVGNASLCAPVDPSVQVSYSVSDSASGQWAHFNSSNLSNSSTLQGAYGALNLEVAVPPGGSAALPLVFSWHYPQRDYLNTTIGNYYSNFWSDAVEVAQASFQDEEDNLNNITTLHQAFFNSSLPAWLQDSLINTLSHVRSAWMTADGRWRQWEAYDCVNIDSVHNDGERHLPYIFFFPETTRIKMLAWAKSALPDGMIQEQLSNGCTGTVPPLDVPHGRDMSDVSSMLIVYAYEMYHWHNDSSVLEAIWPQLVGAAEWQISVSTKYGIPYKLTATYDVLGLADYPTATYNGVFHLLAMRTIAELAAAMGNQTLVARAEAALIRGQQALDDLLWIESPGLPHYAAVQGLNATIMADSMYPQVLAFNLGLGVLVSNSTRLDLHLKAVEANNTTPHGLAAITGGTVGRTDNYLWQMASPDWASNQLRLHGAQAYPDAMALPESSLNLWREVLNDQWNVAGVAGPDAMPAITSHYGYHMVQWHLVPAMSGQVAHLPNGTLTFNPVVASPYQLPVLLPGVVGRLSSVGQDDAVTYELCVSIGELALKHLAVGSVVCPKNDIVLNDSCVSWS